MSAPRALTPNQVTEARTLYATGRYTLADIAQAYGVGRNTIARALVRAGVTLRPRGGPRTRQETRSV